MVNNLHNAVKTWAAQMAAELNNIYSFGLFWSINCHKTSSIRTPEIGTFFSCWESLSVIPFRPVIPKVVAADFMENGVYLIWLSSLRIFTLNK